MVVVDQDYPETSLTTDQINPFRKELNKLTPAERPKLEATFYRRGAFYYVAKNHIAKERLLNKLPSLNLI